MTLKTLQKKLQNYLINTESSMPDISVQALTRDTPNINGILLSSEKRLKIYFDAYRLRLLEILSNDYPKLHTLMGDDAFETIFLQYLERYPSCHFSVRYFGKNLSTLLREDNIYHEHSYLAEMADFEWNLGDTLDAKDALVSEPQILYSIPIDSFGELQVEFHPSLRVLQLEWDVPKLWQDIENEAKPRAPIKSIEINTWILWREDLQCCFRSLTKIEALILNLFQQNYNFAEVCETLCETLSEEEIPKAILSFLQKSLQDKLIRITPN